MGLIVQRKRLPFNSTKWRLSYARSAVRTFYYSSRVSHSAFLIFHCGTFTWGKLMAGLVCKVLEIVKTFTTSSCKIIFTDYQEIEKVVMEVPSYILSQIIY